MSWMILAAFTAGALVTVLVLAVLGGAIWTSRHDDPEIAQALGVTHGDPDLSPATDRRGMTSPDGAACADDCWDSTSGAGEASHGWIFAGLAALALTLDTLIVLGVVKAAEMIRGL